jgi:hypothetical protein
LETALGILVIQYSKKERSLLAEFIDSDFWRACNSLQLDETIALYASRLLGDTGYIGLVNNKHPLIPLSTFQAGYRLLLHGLAAESLHATLVEHKRRRKLADRSHPSAPSSNMA